MNIVPFEKKCSINKGNTENQVSYMKTLEKQRATEIEKQLVKGYLKLLSNF